MSWDETGYGHQTMHLPAAVVLSSRVAGSVCLQCRSSAKGGRWGLPAAAGGPALAAGLVP